MYPEEIVDTYVDLELQSISIRPLSHHGFARRTARKLGYSTREFLDFYDRALTHLFQVNDSGYYLEESYVTLLLQHILTPFPTGYVDLRSPTGAGFGALVYNYDGYVYPSDEARMLVEIGDTTFRLGRVTQNYTELMRSPVMHELLRHGVAEALPVCSECPFVPYCGADPINHWTHTGALSGPEPETNFCRKQMHLFHYLFRTLHDAPEQAMKVLMSWWTRRPIVVAALPQSSTSVS
jgi:radical SAM protein with 4Fe4S-binding SPASM domain